MQPIKNKNVLWPDKTLLAIGWGFSGRRRKFLEIQKKLFGTIYLLMGADFGHPNIITFGRGEDIRKHIRMIEPDVIHAFVDNTQTAYMALTTGVPTITDMYDCAVMRGQKDGTIKEVYTDFDNPRVFSSEKHAEFIRDNYGLKDYTVIPNLTPKKWLNFKRTKTKPKKDSLVYFGSINQPNPIVGKRGFEYRWYMHLLEIFDKHNIEVHVYPQPFCHLNFDNYKNLHLHETLNGYKEIYTALSGYHVGLAGYNNLNSPLVPLRYAQSCVPNKAFDYMYAGIPTVGYQVGFAEKYINKWGVCTDNFAELVDAYYQAKEMEIDFPRHRAENVLDNYLETLAELYQSVM